MRVIVRLLFLAAIISVVSATLYGKNGVERLVQLNRTEGALKRQEAAMLKEIRQLEHEIHRATYDSQYLTNQARAELLVSSPEEVVYIFPEDRSTAK